MERIGTFYGPLLTTMSHKRLDLHSQRLEESDGTNHISHVLPQGTQSSSHQVVLRYRVFATKRAFSGLPCFLRLMPINAMEHLQTSWFVFDRSHDIVCYVLICHGRPDDVLTQPVGCRPYPRGSNLNRSKTFPNRGWHNATSTPNENRCTHHSVATHDGNHLLDNTMHCTDTKTTEQRQPFTSGGEAAFVGYRKPVALMASLLPCKNSSV